MGHGVTQTHVEAGLLKLASEVFVLLETRGLHFSSKCDIRVEGRFASDDLSLVIFGQPTEPPPKFLILCG